MGMYVLSLIYLAVNLALSAICLGSIALGVILATVAICGDIREWKR